MSNVILQTRVKKDHVVSTLYRPSSARGDDVWYFEHMVFKTNIDGSLGAIVDQRDSFSEQGAIETHLQMVKDCAKLSPTVEMD